MVKLQFVKIRKLDVCGGLFCQIWPSFLIFRLLLTSKALLMWVRKDKHTYMHTNIHAYIHTRNVSILLFFLTYFSFQQFFFSDLFCLKDPNFAHISPSYQRFMTALLEYFCQLCLLYHEPQ